MRNSIDHIPRLLTMLAALITLACSGSGDRESVPAPFTQSAATAAAPPIPDWRDQIIYFAMIDRFDDGDAGNNDQGAQEYDPADNAKFSGGDLKGLTRRVDYIRGLGATALWITPPVRNRWWDKRSDYGGYHGYWAEHLMEVDPHFGTLEDYRDLSAALHARGMYLVQDIVVNHMGNYFSYPEHWRSEAVESGFALNADHAGLTAPTQWPFSQNDVRDPAQRQADIYHWTPAISDHQQPEQELRHQLADLDDLNTENPTVRDALRQSYGYWIREAGVDAYRVDTAFYVPEEFFIDFLNNAQSAHPGILHVARSQGKPQFHVFGEGFGMDRAYADEQMRKINRYLHDAEGRDILPGMINFTLYGTIGDVFVRGRPSAELGDRIRRVMALHPRPHLMPTFVDNHDVERFLSAGSEAALKQSLLLTMTLPGIPTIYYGTEQGFSTQRQAMFAKGFQSGGHDRFDTEAPLYRYIQSVAALRRGNLLFSRGTPEVLFENAAAPGALVYRMRHQQASVIVVFNTSDRPTLLHHLDTGLAAGTVLETLFAIDGSVATAVVDREGRLNMTLAPRSGMVLKVADSSPHPTANPVVLSMDTLSGEPQTSDFPISGSISGSSGAMVVVDGNLDAAQPVTPEQDGRWTARVRTDSMIDPSIEHSVVIWDPASGSVSQRATFRVARGWTLLAELDDPSGDDHGPNQRYRYPKGKDWTQHPADLRKMRVFSSGGAARIELTMSSLGAIWNPVNGFDHVAFTLCFDVPGAGSGQHVLPLQNASLPEGMQWQFRLRAHGWSNALFSQLGASAQNEGTAIMPGADIRADHNTNTVTFTLPASALGNQQSLSGMKLYVNTWDYDGGYKTLRPDANTQGFSGGDGARDALIMDDLLMR